MMTTGRRAREAWGQAATGCCCHFASLVAAIFLGMAGCRSNSDLVEAELRTREGEIRQLRDELCRCRSYNKAMQRELHGLHSSAAVKLSPELAAQTYRVQSIALGRQTGGYNTNSHDGDDALQVVVEPRDPDGHTIKAPGYLLVHVIEINSEGLKRPLSSWHVSEEELRRSWRSGLLSTGYFVVLPWKTPPTTDKLRVVVQFTLADGRLFEADKDVIINLPAALRHKGMPSNGGKIYDSDLLPQPRVVPPRPSIVPPSVLRNVVPRTCWPTTPTVEILDPSPLAFR